MMIQTRLIPAALWLTLSLTCHAGPVHDAVSKRDLAALGQALKKEPKQINARCYPDFVTPLYLAVAEGDPAIVKRLLDAGADPSMPAVPGAMRVSPVQRSLLFCGEPHMSKVLDDLVALPLHAAFGNLGGMKNQMAGLFRMPPVTAEEKQARIQVLELLYAEKSARQEAKLPILMASATGNADALRLLLDSGVEADARDGVRMTPLHYAVLGGADPAVIQLLVSKGADVDAGDKYGDTPLMLAAWMGNLGTVEALIASGAALDAEDIHRQSVICYAARSGNDDLVKLIHRKGGRDLIRYAKHEVLFHAAASAGSMAIVEALLAEGVDVNIRDQAGFTPLLTALEHDRRELAALLLRNGAARDAKTNDGMGMIHVACSAGNTELVGELLAAGEPDKALLATLLSSASYKGRRDIVTLLIDKGADVNAPTGPDKIPPLGWALLTGVRESSSSDPHPPTEEERMEIVERLIQHGARVDWKGSDGQVLLHMAINANRGEKIIQALLKAGAQPDVATGPNSSTALHRAAAGGRMEIVRLLLDAGADRRTRNRLGDGLLHLAAAGGHMESLRFLIDKGLPVNDKSPVHGGTPLHYAVLANSPECVELLLAKGALSNAQDVSGCVPLIQAIDEKYGMELFKASAKERGESAVHHLRNRLRVIHLLLKAGARTDMSIKSPEAGNFNSLTDYARSNGTTEIVELLENPPPVTRKPRNP